MRKPFMKTCPNCRNWFKVKGDPNDQTFGIKSIPLNYSVGAMCPRCKRVSTEPVLINGRPTKLFFEVFGNQTYDFLDNKGYLN